jgi:ribosomal protein S18 acetylase RimI-like enzyme
MESRQGTGFQRATDARFSVRRLGLGDAAVLRMLCQEEEDFDLEGRGKAATPLSEEAARAYLADPAVLHWVAEADGRVVGHMSCSLLRKRAGDPSEVLLYEIGVRGRCRRRGVGRALVGALNDWMAAHQVKEVWVVADNPVAVAFYRAAGFKTAGADAAVYMSR